jgi:thymidylate synthase
MEHATLFHPATRHKPSPNGPARDYVGEAGYMQMLADVLAYGSEVPGRQGQGAQDVNRIKLFDCRLRFDMRKAPPLFTARSTPPRIAIEEFWTFLRGEVDVHTQLAKKGITIWEGNTNRRFLDSVGLHHLPEGHIGKSYSFQIRHFNGELDGSFAPVGGVDQLQGLVDNLVGKPFDSRHIITMWNPGQMHEKALPPCWFQHQFLVTLDEQGNKLLNLSVTSRSADLLFGTPFNVCQYGYYLLAVAELMGVQAGELSCHLVDAHIYGSRQDVGLCESDLHVKSQVQYVQELLTREIHSVSEVKMAIRTPLDSLDDLLAMTWEDVAISPYAVNKEKLKARRPVMA